MRRRQLSAHCSRSSRVARGTAGALMGGLVGGVLGLVVGTTVSLRRLARSAPGEPISDGLATAVGITATGAAVGAVAFAWAPEC
jgi:hypothetical protein